MRKIFSFMLIAAGLLIGSQASAVNVSKQSELLKAIKDAGANTTVNITLTANIALDTTLTIPAVASQEHLVVNLNLGGKTLSNNPSKAVAVINLNRGTLNISNGNINGELTCPPANPDELPDVITVRGSETAYTGGAPYTILNIAQDVTVNSAKNALVVNGTNGAYGVIVNVDGTIMGTKYGIKVNGTVKGDVETENVAIINVNSTAVVTTADVAFEEKSGTSDKSACAMYCSGKAIYHLRGTITGYIGVVIKAGDVTIDGADIKATGTDYADVTAGGSGINGGSGCGLLIDSQKGYQGDMNVTIQGDTKIEGASGYAVKEVIVTGTTGTMVDQVKFEGGTIVGGQQGAMNFTQETAKDTTVVIYGANVQGATTIGSNPNDTINSLKGEGTFTTTIEINGKDVIVVSKGGQPATTPISLMKDTTDSANVIIAAEHIKITANKTYGYVEMPNATSDTIISGVTLRIGKLVMCDDAQLVILPGGKLIIYGEQGIVAGKVSNLVIKADSTGTGILLFNPAVTSNRTPFATVEYISKYAKKEDGQYKWEIITSPFAKLTNITRVPDTGTGWQYYDKGWQNYANVADVCEHAKPFGALAVTNVSNDGGVAYTFTGQLQGNLTGKLTLNHGFNYIGNAYIAKMQASTLVENLKSAGISIKPVIYLWDDDAQNYFPYEEEEAQGNLNPMQFFVIYSNQDGEANLDYESLIWENNQD